MRLMRLYQAARVVAATNSEEARHSDLREHHVIRQRLAQAEVEHLFGFGQRPSQAERPMALGCDFVASCAQHRKRDARAQCDDDHGGGTDEDFRHAKVEGLNGTADKVAGCHPGQTLEEAPFLG